VSSRTSRFPAVSRLVLFGALSLSTLTSCAELFSPEEPPCILLGAEFRRVEERHHLSVELRAREGTLPEGGTVRFTLHAGVPGKEGSERQLAATLQGSGDIVPLGEDRGSLRLVFDSPFAFLPKDPTKLSDLTLRALYRDGRALWRGELLYPYVITETTGDALSKTGYLE
jgi:hypothetical protein